VKQFLNRVPENAVHAPAIAAYLERYVQSEEINP
jgi:hypothetical protein